MGTTYVLAILFLVTALAFIGWALVSKSRTERKRHDPKAPKSALAMDGPGANPVTAPRGAEVGQRSSDTAAQHGRS